MIKNIEFSKGKKAYKKAIFFDRDGVLMKDVHYIKEPKDVLILEGVIDLIKLAKKRGYINIVITNQSGIKRQLFKWEDYERVTNKMLQLINIQDCFNAIATTGEGPSIFLSTKAEKTKSKHDIKSKKDFKIDLNQSILIEE